MAGVAADDVASSAGEALGACVMNEGAVGPAAPAEPVGPPDGINPTSWTIFGVSSLNGEGSGFVSRTTVGGGRSDGDSAVVAVGGLAELPDVAESLVGGSLMGSGRSSRVVCLQCGQYHSRDL